MGSEMCIRDRCNQDPDALKKQLANLMENKKSLESVQAIIASARSNPNKQSGSATTFITTVTQIITMVQQTPTSYAITSLSSTITSVSYSFSSSFSAQLSDLSSSLTSSLATISSEISTISSTILGKRFCNSMILCLFQL